MFTFLYKPLVLTLVYILFHFILQAISKRIRSIDFSDIPTQARLDRFRRGLDWLWFLVWVIEMILLLFIIFRMP